MRRSIIEALIQYPFRLTAAQVADRVLDGSDLDASFALFEELLNLTREGLVRRYSRNGTGLFVINLERPTGHAPLKLLNMLIVCAAGAPLYTVVDAAAFGEVTVDEKELHRWQGVDCHVMHRVVILSTAQFTNIYSLDAWFPWIAEQLPQIIGRLKSYAITADYFLSEPEENNEPKISS